MNKKTYGWRESNLESDTVAQGIWIEQLPLLRQTNIKARWNTKKIVTGEKCQPNPGDILQGHNFNQSRKISVPIRRWLEITLYKLTLDEQAINESGREKLFKESNGTKANCNANVTQVWKSHIYIPSLINHFQFHKRLNRLPLFCTTIVMC